jgi:hypothetical protein
MGCDESCESVYAHGLPMHQKCSNHALINLLFELCKSLCIIDPFVTCPSPHRRAPTHFSTPEMLQAREHTPTPSSVVFTFGLKVESIMDLRVRQ